MFAFLFFPKHYAISGVLTTNNITKSRKCDVYVLCICIISLKQGFMIISLISVLFILNVPVKEVKIYTLPCVKQRASGKLSSAPCDDLERWDGGG